MIKIAILQRGWIFVGNFAQEGSVCTLTNALNIRRWGTSKGLGELAQEGKQSNTQLDPAGTVTFHELTAVALIDCNEEV